MNTCCICGSKTRKDMNIVTRKNGVDHHFCTFHFNRYLFESNKIIEKMIKENKLLIKKETFK